MKVLRQRTESHFKWQPANIILLSKKYGELNRVPMSPQGGLSPNEERINL